MFHFYAPKNTAGFLMFSGGIEMEHWLKMGWGVLYGLFNVPCEIQIEIAARLPNKRKFGVLRNTFQKYINISLSVCQEYLFWKIMTL